MSDRGESEDEKQLSGLQPTMETEMRRVQHVSDFCADSREPDTAVMTTFEQCISVGGAHRISLEEHFRKSYRPIFYPNLAHMQTGGTRIRETFVPPEFCHTSQDRRVLENARSGDRRDRIAVLIIDDHLENIYRHFLHFLWATCNEMGMRMTTIIQNSNSRQVSPGCKLSAIEKILSQFVKEGAELILVTLPTKDGNFYQEVKGVSEINVGVMTQCVTKQVITKTMEKCDRTAVVNLALKIKEKLGGRI